MADSGTNKANLGKELERMLVETHEVYATQRIASIRKHPVEWKYTSKAAYDKMRSSRQDFVAITNSGRYITRVKSNVDFSGVAAGRHISFDAKQVSRLNFPLGDLPDHQLLTLVAAEECGAISGLMIFFSTYGKVYFVSAGYIERVFKEMRFALGKKSISMIGSWCLLRMEGNKC